MCNFILHKDFEDIRNDGEIEYLVEEIAIH